MDLSLPISRRQVLRAGAVGAAAYVAMRPFSLFAADTAAPAPQSAREPLYAFIVLGDIHYDLPEHHDMEWVKADKPNDIRQIENYCKVTVEHTPRLMKRIKQMIQESAVPVAFVVQNGDFVEGLCGSMELHTKQLTDATGMVDQMQFGVPFLINKGNHDITGPGAPEAYDKVLFPWLSRQLGTTVDRAGIMRRQGDDLFVLFDGYKTDLDWLEQGLKDNGDARHTFLFSHQPVVPSDARANWGVFGRPVEAANRQRLLNILGARQMMAFTAHLHKYSFLERETPNGRFWEMGTCSVVRADPTKPKHFLDGIEQYGEQLTDLEPNFSPTSLDERKQILRDEKPMVRQYSLNDCPGCTLVSVFADGIKTETFAGTDTAVWDMREVKMKVRV